MHVSINVSLEGSLLRLTYWIVVDLCNSYLCEIDHFDVMLFHVLFVIIHKQFIRIVFLDGFVRIQIPL